MASVLAVSRVQGLATLATLQVGLTGSIGMGKSTCTKHFRAMGFPVFDADAAVNELYSAGGAAVDPIGKLFPDAIVDSAVSRPVLSKKVVEDSKIFKVLEEIVHPLVSAKRRQFFEKAKSEGHFMVIYDIPLLLENPANHEVDYTIVVTADADVQKERVLMRPGMTEEKFISILSKQMPDKKKREHADFLILTDYEGFAPGRSQVANIVEKIIEKNPALWAAWKSQSQEVKEKKNVTKAPLEACSLSKEFDLVVFDLDDTLVPVWNPIKPAMEALFLFMDEHMPKTAVDAKETLRTEMMRISSENILLAHDLTEVRRLALNTICTPHGEQSRVEDALKLFVSIRSDVSGHLYDDVIPCLNYLTKEIGVRVAVLTNGNANLTSCTVLGEYVTLSLGACDVGAMKPSPVPFISISQRTGVHPSRILFIGDSFEKDVIGATACGMTGGLILRRDFKTQIVSDLEVEEDRIAHGDLTKDFLTPENESLLSHSKYIILNTLFPKEINDKVNTYFSKR